MDNRTRSLIMGAAGAGGAEKLYVEDVFSTWLYTGNGSTQTITNGIDLSGKGGLVWIKGRSDATGHRFTDTARGATKSLESNSAAAEATESTGVTSFSSTGFALGADADYNTNAATYCSWTFRKAEKFFDVVTYTGTGAARSVNHSLGSTPGVIIIKRTDNSADWIVYHRSTGTGQFLYLNDTSGAIGASKVTTVSASTFSLPTDSNVNADGGSFVAYLFAHDAGGFGDSGNDNAVSCGSFTESGSGVNVNLGWEPQWLLVKRSDAAGSWVIFDNMRGTPVDNYWSALVPNTSSAESGSYLIGSPTATGFKFAASGAGGWSNGTYIYIAIRRGGMKKPTSGDTVLSLSTSSGIGRAEGANGSTLDYQTINDMVILRPYRTSATTPSWIWTDKLRGYGVSASAYIDSTSAAAETTTSLVTRDQSNYLNFPGSSFPTINYSFRRVAGFFDVVAYDGGGTSKNHNLGVKPELAFIKVRSTSFRNWIAAVQGGTGGYLNTSDPINVSNLFIDLANATTTTFPVNGNPEVGQSGQTYIAYLFASCPGVSKVGSYTGTGTTLNIDCGFTAGARFVLIKRTDSTGDWYVWDTARGIVSGNDSYLLLNSTAAEVTNTDYIDPLSSGFQISSTAPAAINANGGSFIYLAIA